MLNNSWLPAELNLKTSSWQPEPSSPRMDSCHARINLVFFFFWEILSTCFISWISTLASHMKHNPYHRGHSIITDKDEVSTACWHRNLKGIRYCSLMYESQILAREKDKSDNYWLTGGPFRNIYSIFNYDSCWSRNKRSVIKWLYFTSQ